MHSKYSTLLLLQPQDFKLNALNFVKAETMFVYSTSACVCELWPAYTVYIDVKVHVGYIYCTSK